MPDTPSEFRSSRTRGIRFVVMWFLWLWYRYVDRECERVVRLPDRSVVSDSDWNRWVGDTGERLAVKAVSGRGGKPLYRNFKPRRGGEVDLVYRDGEILAFAEVKTRTSEQFGQPAQAVNQEKKALITRGANAWLKALGRPEVIFRFDIIEVILQDGQRPEIRVIEAAFTTPQSGIGM